MNSKILMIDEDVNFYQSIERTLTHAGFTVVQLGMNNHSNEQIIEEVIKIAPDMILLEVDAGTEDEEGRGIVLGRAFKQSPDIRQVPFIFLTKNKNVEHKVEAFKFGAADYVDKTCHELELMARIRGRMKESNVINSDFVQVGRLRVNVVTQNVYYIANNPAENNPEEVELSFLEYKILMFFIKNREKNISRTMIINNVWGENTHITNRTVDVHISGLRRRCPIIADYIKTIYGQGYKFSCDQGPLQM